MIGAIYHDFAMIYNEKKDYIRADQYISKAIMVMGHDEAANAYLLKAEIMFNLNKLDSASYFLIKKWVLLILMGGPYVMMGCIR